MMNKRWGVGLAGACALSGLVGAGTTPAVAEELPPVDPEVVALRQALAAQPMPAGATSPAEVTSDPPMDLLQAQWNASLYARSWSGGEIAVAANDYIAIDNPGVLTTTARIYGNAAAFREGAGAVKLTSTFTCTGVGVSSLTIGTSGASVTGGSSSQTLTWTSSRTNTDTVRQHYDQDGHFRCKTYNVGARTTRRAVGSATYKEADTRVQDEYSFSW